MRVPEQGSGRQIAAAGGLTDHENRLTAAIERTDTTNDWKTVEITTEIDIAEIDSEVARMVGDDGLLPALVRFALMVPTGDPERSRAFVIELANEHPLRSLMTRFEFGPEGGVVRKPAGHEERVEDELGKHDAQAIMLFASLSGEGVLRALHDRHRPDLQPLLVDPPQDQLDQVTQSRNPDGPQAPDLSHVPTSRVRRSPRSDAPQSRAAVDAVLHSIARSRPLEHHTACDPPAPAAAAPIRLLQPPAPAATKDRLDDPQRKLGKLYRSLRQRAV